MRFKEQHAAVDGRGDEVVFAKHQSVKVVQRHKDETATVRGMAQVHKRGGQDPEIRNVRIAWDLLESEPR